MCVTRPIRVDAGETKYLAQRLDKAHLISSVSLSESAVDIKHHKFHWKRMSPNETSSATPAESERGCKFSIGSHVKVRKQAGQVLAAALG
jgi:superoxide dismutase